MAADRWGALDDRLYRAALRLCPGEFRREHGEEMAGDFAQARGDAAAAGASAVWTLRGLMAVDLARTIVIQWLRTGLPVIGGAAVAVSLSLAAAVATVARRVTGHLAAVAGDVDALGIILLASVAVMVIVATIIFNQWANRPRHAGRR